MKRHSRPSFEDMIRWVDSRFKHVEKELEDQKTEKENEVADA